MIDIMKTYLSHIEGDFASWEKEIATLDRDGVYARAKEIAYMPRIYEKLRVLADEAQMEYLLQLAYPVQEVYKLWHELDELAFDSLVDLNTVLYDGCDRNMFAGAKRIGSPLPNPAQFVFFRKPYNAMELKSSNATHTRYTANVIHVIELSAPNYETFGRDLLGSYAFIDRYKSELRFDNATMTCYALLVKSPDSKDGILVCSEGYDYSRYAAFVPDYRVLDFKDAPVLSADIRVPARTHRQQER